MADPPGGPHRRNQTFRLTTVTAGITSVLAVVVALTQLNRDLFFHFDGPTPTPTPQITATSATPRPTPATEVPVKSVNLTSLVTSAASSPFFNEQTAVIGGAAYPQSVVIQFDGAEPNRIIEYTIGRKYSTLTATLGLEDGSSGPGNAQIEFFGDGRLLSKYQPRSAVVHPLRLRLDGVDRLTVVTTASAKACCIEVAVGFPVLGAQ